MFHRDGTTFRDREGTLRNRTAVWCGTAFAARHIALTQ